MAACMRPSACGHLHHCHVLLAAERLDDARVAASRASPMSDALELCARYTSAGDMEALLPELTGIIRRGVGLNTKVGAHQPGGGLAGWMC